MSGEKSGEKSGKKSKEGKEGKVIVIKSAEQYDSLKNEGLVVIDFNTSWCGPCKRFAPVFEGLAKKYPNAKLLSVDAEKINHVDCDDISSVPSFKIWLNGELQREFSGVDVERLERYIQRYLE